MSTNVESIEGHHMDFHYYQFLVCMKLFHNNKCGWGEPRQLQLYKGKKKPNLKPKLWEL